MTTALVFDHDSCSPYIAYQITILGIDEKNYVESCTKWTPILIGRKLRFQFQIVSKDGLSFIINTTAKANDTTNILQTFR